MKALVYNHYAILSVRQHGVTGVDLRKRQGKQGNTTKPPLRVKRAKQSMIVQAESVRQH